tara:strand:+ start:146 stop:466 length:321 start_codon:yes stop_codon:yes gene_type:complete
MTSKVYVIEFKNTPQYEEGKELLVNARIAASGLYSDSSLRIDVHNWHDDDGLRLLIDASEAPGQTVLRIFSSLLDHELGEGGFIVKPASLEEINKVDSWKRGEHAG